MAWREAIPNARIKERQGNYAEARTLALQSLQLSLALKDKRTLAQTLEQLAGLISLQSDHAAAARLIGAAEALRDSIFAARDPLYRADFERHLARIHANLDDSSLTSVRAEGWLMTLEQAVEYALSE